MNIYVLPVEQAAGCLLYTFAMILETEPDILIKELGHDGMEKIWPSLPEPYCYKGFHIQEMIDLCIARELHCTEIQATPASLPPSEAYGHMDSHNIGHHMIFESRRNTARFKDHLKGREGVLYGRTNKGVTHAWAWDGEKAHNPQSGTGVVSLGDIRVSTCWLISK